MAGSFFIAFFSYCSRFSASWILIWVSKLKWNEKQQFGYLIKIMWLWASHILMYPFFTLQSNRHYENWLDHWKLVLCEPWCRCNRFMQPIDDNLFHCGRNLWTKNQYTWTGSDQGVMNSNIIVLMHSRAALESLLFFFLQRASFKCLVFVLCICRQCVSNVNACVLQLHCLSIDLST